MSTEAVPVIKFVFEKDWKILDQAMDIKPSYSSIAHKSATDLNSFLATVPSSLVICSLVSKNDLVQIASLVKLNKKLTNSPIIKIVVINFSKNREFEKALGKLGIMDIIETNVNIKSLRYKIDFFIKSINAQLKKNNAKELSTKTSKSSESLSQEDAKKEDFSKVNWVDELDAPEDIWLINQDSDCKKVLNKWLLKIMGPSPYVGQWVEVPRQKGIWRFDLKSETKHFLLEGNGSWFFRGDQKPEFVWKENRWLVTGWDFELFFEDKSQRVSRLLLKNKVMTVAKNSMYADTKKDIIIQSFDKELLFTKDAEKNEESAFKNDKLINKNLEGNAKTDQLEIDPLSGKGKTSEINNRPLSMELNDGDQKINNKPLEQKGDSSKKSSFWKGQNSTENPLSDNMDGPAGKNNLSSDLLDQETSNQNEESFYKGVQEKSKTQKKSESDFSLEATKTSSGDPLTQKKETEEVESYYKNKSNEDKIPEKKKKNQDSQDKNDAGSDGASVATEKLSQSKQLDLKKETEEVETHYKNHNPKAKESEKSAENLASPTIEMPRKGNRLDLEQETEDVETHYKGHNPINRPEEKNKKDKKDGLRNDQSQSDDQTSPASEKLKKGKQLGLEQETEEVETHYKGHNPVAKDEEKKNKSKTEHVDAKEKKEKDQSSPASDKLKKGKQLDLKHETEEIQTHYKSGKRKLKTEDYNEEENKKDEIKSKKKNIVGEKSSDENVESDDVDDLSLIESKGNDKGKNSNSTHEDSFTEGPKKNKAEAEESILDNVIDNKFSKDTNLDDDLPDIDEDFYGDLSEIKAQEGKSSSQNPAKSYSEDENSGAKRDQKKGNDVEEDLYKKDTKGNVDKDSDDVEGDNSQEGLKKAKGISASAIETARASQAKEESISSIKPKESMGALPPEESSSHTKTDKDRRISKSADDSKDDSSRHKARGEGESLEELLARKKTSAASGQDESENSEAADKPNRRIGQLLDKQRDVINKELPLKGRTGLSLLIDKLYERNESESASAQASDTEDDIRNSDPILKKVINQ